MVLQSIRDRLSGIIAIFIFAILIIPFAFVGVNSYFTSSGVNSVALVNDEEITANEFNQGFQLYRRRMQAQLGADFDPEAFDQAIVRRQFLDQLIDERLLAQVSVDAGLTVSNATLAEAIRSMPAFELDGEFNADVYQASLSSQGKSPQQFEDDVRTSMILNQFPTAIATSSIATKWEIEDYARLADQERAFEALVVPVAVAEPQDGDPGAEESAEASATGEAPVVGEDELVAWYDAHQDDYLSEEQVVVEYLELDAASFAPEEEPDEETLKARFEDQKARFITPESRLVSHILIEVPSDAPQVDVDTARDQAEELSRRAREGEDFAALARENSQDVGSAETGGDLGWIEPGYMVQAFEDAAYALTPEHPVSDPVQTGFGWHVIELRDIRPSEGMSYTEARDILLAEFHAEASERQYLEQADRLVDIVYEDPTTLSAAAEELGLEIKEAGPFGRQGGAGIAANPEVVRTAFSDLVLAQRSVSDPVNLGDNHIVLLHLKEHFPQAVKPLAVVREEVTASILRQRAMEEAEGRAQALLTQIEEGAEIEALSEAGGLDFAASEAATRTSGDIDADLRDRVFLIQAAPEDLPVTQVVELPAGYAVIRLEAVRDGQLTDDDATRKLIYDRRISNANASAEAIGFLRMLRAQSTIEVFEDRL